MKESTAHSQVTAVLEFMLGFEWQLTLAASVKGKFKLTLLLIGFHLVVGLLQALPYRLHEKSRSQLQALTDFDFTRPHHFAILGQRRNSFLLELLPTSFPCRALNVSS